MDCLRIKVLRRRHAIQELLLSIYNEVKEPITEEPVVREVSGKARLKNLNAKKLDPNFAQPRSTVPLIQNLHSLSSNSQTQEEPPVPIQDSHRTGMITAPITTDMLRNALLATEEHMRAV